MPVFLGFPCGSVSKVSAYNAGNLVSISGLGRSPGEGKGCPLQYSGLENSMDCIVHGISESWAWFSDFYFHFPCTGPLGTAGGGAGLGADLFVPLGEPLQLYYPLFVCCLPDGWNLTILCIHHFCLVLFLPYVSSNRGFARLQAVLVNISVNSCNLL